jgi:hypothetical protein
MRNVARRRVARPRCHHRADGCVAKTSCWYASGWAALAVMLRCHRDGGRRLGLATVLLLAATPALAHIEPTRSDDAVLAPAPHAAPGGYGNVLGSDVLERGRGAQ